MFKHEILRNVQFNFNTQTFSIWKLIQFFRFGEKMENNEERKIDIKDEERMKEREEEKKHKFA